MPIRDTDTLRLIGRSVLLPIKWAAELLDLHLHPHQFLKFIVDKTVGWTGREEKYLIDWARADARLKIRVRFRVRVRHGCYRRDTLP